MIKKFALFYLFGLIFLKLFSFDVHALELLKNKEVESNYKKIILVINQVRGSECCDEGSEKYFLQQIDSLKENNLKGNFALRYDALLNPGYTNILRNLAAEQVDSDGRFDGAGQLESTDQVDGTDQFELGAFLEITPKLAQDAGVLYKGDITDWYKAQNVYTVGYEFQDRKKIIDRYMEEFFVSFGVYPKFSTAWIMDTDSVNYMNEKYGIYTHQITREQWGTDSYTMSGGPVHYPYFASKNWLFVKGESTNNGQAEVGGGQNLDQNQKQTLVLRQTGSDPLFNYGDNTNSFTTQPNDYAIGNRGFDYFKNLKNQLINQQQNNYGFLLLGLENSMAEKYQDEYSKQINSIKDDGEVVSMTVSEFNQFAKDNVQSVVGLVGNDLVNNSDEKSFWINAKNYRARFIYKDGKLFLSDLRSTNEELEDPYNNYVAQDLAFWVTPFIFNASQQYSTSEPINLSFKENFLHNLRKRVLPEYQKVNFEAKSSRNDFSTFFDGMQISENVKEMLGFSRNENGQLLLTWIDESEKKNEVLFDDEQITTNFVITAKDLSLEQSDFLIVNKTWKGFEVIFKNTSLSFSTNCSLTGCKLSFGSLDNEAFSNLREDYYPYFFPEITDRVIDNIKSVFYAHNRYAVVGKNPVRFVFIPKDEKGFATNYQGEPEIIVIPELVEIDLRDKQIDGTTIFNVNSATVGKYEVRFMVNDLIDKEETIYFAPDCKNNLAYCMLHPVESMWYLSSMFYTKLRNF